MRPGPGAALAQSRYILAFIYAARTAAIVAYISLPLSAWASTCLFAAVMGLLWLSTVPPTNATVAQIFGVSHLSMLGGLGVLQPPDRQLPGRVAGRPAV